MSAIVDLILGVVTSIGGFVEVGSISTSAQAGSEFGYQLLWAVAAAGVMLAMLVEMSGRLSGVSKQPLAAAGGGGVGNPLPNLSPSGGAPARPPVLPPGDGGGGAPLERGGR